LDVVQDYFGSSINSDMNFVEHIYSNTLGKNYAQDPEGIDYWVNELNQGKARGEVVAALITAALSSENAGNSQDQFNNKVDVSNYTADYIYKYSESISFSSFIDGVTYEDSTVSAACSAVDEVADGQSTQALALTKGTDTISGTVNNDSILGTDETYTAVDSIDGAEGMDTLTLMCFTAVTDQVTVSSVETVVLKNADSLTNVDASAWTGVNVLTFSGSTSSTAVSNIQQALDVELYNNNYGAQIVYDDDVLGLTNASQSIKIEDSSATVSIETGGDDQITTLAVTTTGDNVLYLDENDIQTVHIDGRGSLALLSSGSTGKLIQVSTVEASSASGNLSIDLSAVDMDAIPGNIVTVKLGSGDDEVMASAFDNIIDAGSGDDTVVVDKGLDDNDLLNGGDGWDLLSIPSASAVAALTDENTLSIISGFESLGISDELNYDQALDISLFGGNSAVIEAGLAGNQELTGFTTGSTIEIRTDASETDVLTITMSGADEAGSNSDTLNVVFNSDLEAEDGIYESVLDVKGINTISVTTQDSSTTDETALEGNLPDAGDGYQLSLLHDGNVNTINVTGEHAFQFAASSTSTLETLSASTMTGNMTLDFTTEFGGTQGVNITCADGADNITGSVYSDIILAGAGDDTLNISLGADQVTGGNGADTFSVKEAQISTSDSYTSILDFSAVSDAAQADRISNIAGVITADASTVDVAAAEASGGDGMDITADVVNGIISLSGSDASNINSFTEWLDLTLLTGESGSTIGFEFSGNTYIVEVSGSDDSTDTLLELTGVTSITTLSSTAGVDTVIISG